MSDKDSENITYSHTLTSISSPGGQKFLKEKFQPKIELIRKYFPHDWQEKIILDVGIGYGSFLSLLEQNGFKHLFGMDPFAKSIEMSREVTKADLRKGKLENEIWPFENQMFDVITCFDVVEHLIDPQVFFVNSKRYLKKEGIIILSTPNGQFPYYFRSIPFLGITDRNPTHFNIHEPSYWTKLAENCGFTIIKEWKGEHLTHIKIFPEIIEKFCRIFRLDHRSLPIINSLEQSFCMALKVNN